MCARARARVVLCVCVQATVCAHELTFLLQLLLQLGLLDRYLSLEPLPLLLPLLALLRLPNLHLLELDLVLYLGLLPLLGAESHRTGWLYAGALHCLATSLILLVVARIAATLAEAISPPHVDNLLVTYAAAATAFCLNESGIAPFLMQTCA